MINFLHYLTKLRATIVSVLTGTVLLLTEVVAVLDESTATELNPVAAASGLSLMLVPALAGRVVAGLQNVDRLIKQTQGVGPGFLSKALSFITGLFKRRDK